VPGTAITLDFQWLIISAPISRGSEKYSRKNVKLDIYTAILLYGFIAFSLGLESSEARCDHGYATIGVKGPAGSKQ
jgi:hypothetical protein